MVPSFTTKMNFFVFTKTCIKERQNLPRKTFFYSFRKVNQRTYKTNKAIDRHYVVKLNSNLVQEERTVVDLHYNLAQMFGATLRDATISLRSESDFIRVIIHSDTLITPIIIPLRKIEKMTPQLILHHINHVL